MSRDKNILTRIKKENQIREPLEFLLYIKKELTSFDVEYLLSVALVLIQEYEESRQSGRNERMFIEYAYYIICKTSFKSGDYSSLYDFSVNYGYYPVAKKIMDLGLISKPNIGHILSQVAIEDFLIDGKVHTLEQFNVFSDVVDDSSPSMSFLAPTSYGKSELIFKHLRKNEDKNIAGIIVPTKALIDQVYRDAKKKIQDRKIIIHDQNYDPNIDKRIFVVVTQERALRLIDDGLVFDVLYIDEAHELLNFDFRYGFSNRSLLLTRLINISRVKNPNLQEIFLSPAITSSESLKVAGSRSIISHQISNNLKLLEVDFLDIEKKNYTYDLFLGSFLWQKSFNSVSEYILEKSHDKNLHFLYRPRFIEEYSNLLSQKLPYSTEIPSEIVDLIEELKMIVHPNFKLVKYLEKGLIYLHGRIPQTIKNYLLKYVRESTFLKHFVANSVVLAGMNLPIDNLFYISGYANIRDLHNLIGRVNRLNEIFSPLNQEIGRIFIPVHFIEIERFPQNQKGNIRKKIESLRGSYKDEIKNPLLENSVITEGNMMKAEEIIHSESEIISTFDDPGFKERLLRSGAQQLLNYSEEGLQVLESRIENLKKLKSNRNLIEVIRTLFFEGFNNGDYNPQYNAERLKHEETIKYYIMFIHDLNTRSLRERIERLVAYWSSKIGEEYLIYVGQQFGEVSKETDRYNSGNNLKVYVDLDSHKSDADYLYNLAITKLQTDEDFVGHEITLLLNTMLEFDIITQEQFDELIYGTKEQDEIRILRLGISRSVYRKLKRDNQLSHIIFDKYGNAKANKELQNYISGQKGIEKFELEQYFI